MSESNEEKKEEILDLFGKLVIENVRDTSLKIAMDIAKYETPNLLKRKQYEALAGLNEQQKEVLCDLLSETITDTIYNFLDMFESNEKFIKLIVNKDGVEYDLCNLSEKMGAEITFMDDDGWIQKFSKIGRFVI